MKKIIIIILSVFLMLPLLVKAQGSVVVDKESIEIIESQTTTFSITLSNSVGKITIVSEDDTIASVDKSIEWIENETITVMVSALKAGTTTITVGVDVATFDEEELIETKTISVTVNKYLINYELNGGSISTACGENSNPLSAGSDSTILICNPTRDGYSFTGWTSDTIGEDAKIGVLSSIVNVSWDGSSTLYTYFKNLKESGTVTLVANWELVIPNIDESTGYKVDNNLLVSTAPNVEVSSLDLGLESIYTTKVTDKDGEEKTEGILKTGDKIQIYLEDLLVIEYTLSIKGDIDGNGQISPLDYIKIKNHIMGTNIIVGDEYINAADISDDGEISPLDYVKVRNYIMTHSN